VAVRNHYEKELTCTREEKLRGWILKKIESELKKNFQSKSEEVFSFISFEFNFLGQVKGAVCPF